jgi:hypothetical protein
VITIAPWIGCLSNVIVLTDVLRHILLQFISLFIANGDKGQSLALLMKSLISESRPTVIMILLCILYPLCMMKDLSALKAVSLFGLCGHVLTLIVLARRIQDGSYRYPHGQFYESANFATTVSAGAGSVSPSIASRSWFKYLSNLMTTSPLAKTVLFASLLSYCLVTHYNVSSIFNLSG